MPHLFAGSWISHNFAIWIGHEEDNTAWDALHQTREYPGERRTPTRGRTTPASLEKAWDEIYIAEGSDWFWWFGDDHSSAQDALVRLPVPQAFAERLHPARRHAAAGVLARPISRKGAARPLHPPRAFLDVKIDGRYTFFEWVSAGRYICQNERGTMAMATAGAARRAVFRLRLDRAVDPHRLRPRRPAAPWRISTCCASVSSNRRTSKCASLTPAERDQRSSCSATASRDGRRSRWRSASIRSPRWRSRSTRWASAVDEHMQFFVELLRDGQGHDRAPREGAIVLNPAVAAISSRSCGMCKNADHRHDHKPLTTTSQSATTAHLAYHSAFLEGLPMPELRRIPLSAAGSSSPPIAPNGPRAKNEPMPAGGLLSVLRGQRGQDAARDPRLPRSRHPAQREGLARPRRAQQVSRPANRGRIETSAATASTTR